MDALHDEGRSEGSPGLARIARWAMLTTLAALTTLTSLAGAETPTDPTRTGAPPDPLFADTSLMELRFEGPIVEVASDLSPDPEDRPFVMHWRTADGETGRLDVELRPRGKSRRDPERCKFPPLRLDVPRKAAAGTPFAEQDKLKIVTHCKFLGSRASDAPVWVAREYLAYRLLGAVTDFGFRVRPLSVTYVEQGGDENVHPAFVIERDERLAERLGLELWEEEQRIEPARLAGPATAVMELFEYLIGNTDFSFIRGPDGEHCCHNAVLLTDGEAMVPIPYDFDLTGLVDKRGATPAPGLPIRRVTQRLYRGLCRDRAELDAAVALYLDAREEIERIVAEEGPFDLSSRARRVTGRFVDDFFDVLTDPDAVEREFVRACRGSS